MMRSLKERAMAVFGLMALVFTVLPDRAWAADGINGADTAWLLTATALVLFMTLPGLALFYGGLVRAQNVVSVLMHCFAIACAASILWLVCGYSLAFSDGGSLNGLVGGLSKAFLGGVSSDTVSGTVPETVFFMFQMTFAIITPALIVGAYPERVSFAMVLGFSALWLLLVYAPVCHWIWGGGWLADRGVVDFAGGLVVHCTAGVSALVFAHMLGRRTGFPEDQKPPHNPGMTMMGAAMLWVGWFGFNAGSALAADGNAGLAMTVTHISAATAAFVWMLIEWIKFKKPSLIGIVTGMVAGLATITPAAGSVGPVGALVIGALSAVLCYTAVGLVKQAWRIDDSLDVFAVHGVGGILGTLLIPVLGSLGPLAPGLPEGMSFMGLLGVQFTGVIAVAAWSGIASAALVFALKGIAGLRVNEEQESQGLDISVHGEAGYTLQ